MNETTTPTDATADLDAEAPAARFRRLADHFATVIAAVPPDRWDAPSPCDGWTVAGVVTHVATTEREFLERMELPTGGDTEGATPVQAWRTASAAMQAALDDPAVAGRTYDGYFGPTTIAESIDTFYALDLVVHGWDVARGAGLDDLEALDPGDLARSRARMAAVGDTVRMAGIFGPEVEVADDADDQDRFLAWTGRTP